MEYFPTSLHHKIKTYSTEVGFSKSDTNTMIKRKDEDEFDLEI
jgi:hypothetical protein